jgi:chemotaxis protein methyltransferase CheR
MTHADVEVFAEEALAAFAAETGLVFPGQRRADFLASARRAMGRHHIGESRRLAERLRHDRRLVQELVCDLAVHESYFFREPAQFQAIRELVLPQLRRERDLASPLQVWSCGCARGEEAYSLAILLEEEGFAGCSRIWGTDISQAALSDAARARYTAWSFRGAQVNLDPRYFRKRGGEYQLLPRIRDRVAFAPGNLIEGPYGPPGAVGQGFDLVLCRNVLIYFEMDTVRAIARWLFQALNPGGWLVTAPADPPLWEHAPFEMQPTAGGIFYRKPMPAPAGARGLVASRAAPLKPEPARPPTRRRRPEAPPVGSPAETAAACVDKVKALANAKGSGPAAELAAEAARRHPTSPELHYLRAVLLLDLRRHDEAVAEIRRVLFLDRSLVAAHLLLGSTLRRTGDVAGARRAFRNAVRLCAGRPPEAPVALTQNETFGRLAEIAAAELAALPPVDPET